jgi:hypothetical protein
VNVPLGGSLTKLAALPEGSSRSLVDPFAEKRTPWRFWLGVTIVVLIACAWLTGRCDWMLPGAARSSHLLGAAEEPSEHD